MKNRPAKDSAKLVAKQKARAEILDDLENLKSLLDSDVAKSIELLQKPEFSGDSTPSTSAAPKVKSEPDPIEHTSSTNNINAQQQTSLFDQKATPSNSQQHSATQPTIPQTPKKRSNQTTLFQLESGSQSELTEIQSEAKTRLKQHMEKLVQQQKHHHLRAIHSELESQANLLVQDMVDEIIPIIEVELRKRLQQEMEYYVLELLTHPEAPHY